MALLKLPKAYWQELRDDISTIFNHAIDLEHDLEVEMDEIGVSAENVYFNVEALRLDTSSKRIMLEGKIIWQELANPIKLLISKAPPSTITVRTIGDLINLGKDCKQDVLTFEFCIS